MRPLRLLVILSLCTSAAACASVPLPTRGRSRPPAPTPQAHHNRAANAEKHYRKAEQFAAQGKWKASEAQYRAALKIDPGYYHAHAGLAHVLNELGQFEEAIHILEEVVSGHADYAEAHYWLAEALYVAGEFTAAWDHVHHYERLGHTVPKAFRGKLEQQHPNPHGGSKGKPGRGKGKGRGR